MPHSPSGASARPSPHVLIKSLELSALHTSRIQDMVRLNGNRSSAISQNTQRQCHLVDLSPVPIVSIIMSMRDSAATLDSAIRSIIWQTLTDWELVLIDDGSRDDSATRVAAFGDPRIRIIRHEESRGLGGG